MSRFAFKPERVFNHAHEQSDEFMEVIRVGLHCKTGEEFDRYIKLNYPHLYYLKVIS